MRRVGGRRRLSVSDRANASVVPAGEVTDEQAARQVSGGVAAGACDRPHALRPIGPSPSVPRGRTCTARIAPTCTVLPPYAREVGRSSYFVTAFGLRRAACARPGLCISRVPPAHPCLSRLTRTRLHLSDRANVHRAAAPIGGAARCRPTLVTATASDTPYAQLGLCATRVPPARPRRCSACACASGHAPICRRCLIPLRRPDRSAVQYSAPILQCRRPRQRNAPARGLGVARAPAWRWVMHQ